MKNELGFLNINKSVGFTSHDIIAILRKSLGIKQIGHSGTLDPFATGVLVCGIGEATRLLEYLPHDKTYLAEITFGIETDTNDITGNILNKSDFIPNINEININLLNFKGQIKQKPPIFSAIKIKGERAYKLARKNNIGLEDISEKSVEIYSNDIISYKDGKLNLKVHCSGGTYIRSLARDLGKALNTFATLSSLRRIQIGNCFNIENSVSPESLTKVNLTEHLIKPESVLTLSKICLSETEIKDIHHGKSIKLAVKQNLSQSNQNNELQILDNNNNLVAIGLLENNCIIKPKKVLITITSQ